MRLTALLAVLIVSISGTTWTCYSYTDADEKWKTENGSSDLEMCERHEGLSDQFHITHLLSMILFYT